MFMKANNLVKIVPILMVSFILAACSPLDLIKHVIPGGGSKPLLAVKTHVGDQNAKHFARADAAGDIRVDALHDHLKLVSRFPMSVIRNSLRRGDQHVLGERRLFIERLIQLVLLRLLRRQRLYFMRGRYRDGERNNQKSENGRMESHVNMSY